MIMKDKYDYWIHKEDYDEQGVRCISKIGESLTL